MDVNRRRPCAVLQTAAAVDDRTGQRVGQVGRRDVAVSGCPELASHRAANDSRANHQDFGVRCHASMIAPRPRRRDGSALAPWNAMLDRLKVPLSWKEIVKRTGKEFVSDNAFDLGAQQAYYFFF